MFIKFSYKLTNVHMMTNNVDFLLARSQSRQTCASPAPVRKYNWVKDCNSQGNITH